MKIFSFRLKSIIITAVILIAVTFGVYFMASQVSEAVSASERMIPIYNVNKDTNEVAITFNCAISGDVDKILQILEEYNVKATFFMLGSWADDHHEEVTAIFEAGHEIGNHSYSHNDMPSMNYDDIMLDIQKCNETVRNITGHSPTLFRTPSDSYDNKTISAAENLGMYTIQWDVDTLDWKNISADEIVTRVTSKVKSGSIIQMHTGTAHTAEALGEILNYLYSNGFKLVTVGELIYHESYHIDNNGMQISETTY